MMGDTNTPLGTINMWHRSTDITTLLECQAKYALGRIYEPDAEAGYYGLGTAFHLYPSERLSGSPVEAAYQAAEDSLVGFFEAAERSGRETRWTRKRPEESAFQTLRELCERWESDLVPMYSDQGWVPVGVEFQGRLRGEPRDEGQTDSVVTTIDALWQRGSEFMVVDWKSGSTAKANPIQLHIYSYVARHDPVSPLYGADSDRVGLFFHHVAFSKQQDAAPYPGDGYVRGLLEWASHTKGAMRAFGFAPAKPDWYCDYCLYQSKCPAFGGGLADLTAKLGSAKMEYVNAAEGGREAEQ